MNIWDILGLSIIAILGLVALVTFAAGALLIYDGMTGTGSFEKSSAEAVEYDDLSPEAQESFDEGEYHEELQDVDIVYGDEIYTLEAAHTGAKEVLGGIVIVLLSILLGGVVLEMNTNRPTNPYREI